MGRQQSKDVQHSRREFVANLIGSLCVDLLQVRPFLQPNDVKAVLVQTALPIQGVGTGAGYPQLMSAVNQTGAINAANAGIVPNSYVAAAGCQTLASGTDCSQANWN